jgi:hypothetical protein
MNRMMVAVALAATAAMPALAMQQDTARKAAAPTVPAPHTVRGELTLYEQTNFNGDNWVVDGPSTSVHTDWDIHSVSIHPGDRWQICARPRFREPCIVLGVSVHDASLIGVEGQIGSARPAPEEAAAE